MNDSDFVVLAEMLVGALPELRLSQVDKALIYLPPADHLLRGVCFEPSSKDPAGFYITNFAMPLCRPCDYIYFTFGARVRQREGRGGDRWQFEETEQFFVDLGLAFRDQTLPFLEYLADLERLVAIARSLDQESFAVLEGLGYALARLGKTEEAIEVLRRVPPMLGTEIAWERDLTAELRALIDLLVRDPEEARRQFAKTEAEMVLRFGLTQVN